MNRICKGLLIMAPALLVGALTIAAPASAQDNNDEKLAKHFKYMDKNKDGVLQEDEYKMMGKDYQQKFKDADANHDGKLTFDEFKASESKQKDSMPGMKM